MPKIVGLDAANDNRPRPARDVHAIDCRCIRCGGRDDFERCVDAVLFGLLLGCIAVALLAVRALGPDIAALVRGLLAGAGM